MFFFFFRLDERCSEVCCEGVLDSLAKQLCGAMGLQYHSAKRPACNECNEGTKSATISRVLVCFS